MKPITFLAFSGLVGFAIAVFDIAFMGQDIEMLYLGPMLTIASAFFLERLVTQTRTGSAFGPFFGRRQD